MNIHLPSHPRARSLRMRRRLAMGAAAVPLAVLLTACGSGDDSSAAGGYCDAIADAKADFASLQAGDVEKFDEAFATFHTLAEEAPDDINADWKVLDQAIGGLEKALADVGLEVADLDAVGAGDLPEGVNPDDLEALMTDVQQLASDEVASAANAIEVHAFEECDVELAAS